MAKKKSSRPMPKATKELLPASRNHADAALREKNPGKWLWDGKVFPSEQAMLKAIIEAARQAADEATNCDARIGGRNYEIQVRVQVALEPMVTEWDETEQEKDDRKVATNGFVDFDDLRDCR